MSEFQLEYMTPEDVTAVYDIMQAVKAKLENPEIYCTDTKEYIAECLNSHGFGVKAQYAGRIAGFLLVYFPSPGEKEHMGHYLKLEEQELSKVAYMDSAAVLPEYRGRGLQREMLVFAEKSVRLSEYRYLMATVSPENPYSLKNLQDAGYEILCRCEKYGGLSRFIMWKRSIILR